MTLICYFQHNRWDMHQMHGDECKPLTRLVRGKSPFLIEKVQKQLKIDFKLQWNLSYSHESKPHT